MTVRDAIQMLAYNRWANAQYLAAAGRLGSEALHRELSASHGSFFGTLRHVVWAEWLWLGRWREQAPEGPDPSAAPGLPELRPRWATLGRAQARFVAALTDSDLGRVLSYVNPRGETWSYPLEQMLQHLLTHSAYHRGHLAALLRQLGEQPPATDFLVYVDVSPVPER